MSDIEYEDLSEQITFKVKPSMKLSLPSAYKNAEGDIKFKKGNIAAKFIRKAIKARINGSLINNSKISDTLKVMSAGLQEFNRLMALVRPSATIRKQVNMEAIKKAMEEIKRW